MADMVAERRELDGAGKRDPVGGPAVAGARDGINIPAPGDTTQSGIPNPTRNP